MYYSIIIPVYNRPNEVDELLKSLTYQTYNNFETIVVDDGSELPCDDVVSKYSGILNIHYYFKTNSGPGQTRNFGVEYAKGDYVIILDSDVVVPPDYLNIIERELTANPCDAFGGPDRADKSFTNLQKAISFSMTSFFTTGGIRGGRQKLDKFYPRSFNMGVKTSVYRTLGGFSNMRFGEDIDFSIRIYKANYKCRLFSDAWVYHKRRTDLTKFFRQVFNSGIARINLYKKYPDSLKAVHALPAVFTVGVALLLLSSPVTIFGPFLLALYALLIFISAFFKTSSINIAILAVITSFIQLIGYGSGFIYAWWLRYVLGKDEFSAFNKTFYK